MGFLAISIEPDAELVRAGAAKMGVQMQVAISLGETLGPLSVNQVPSTIFVDRDGVIVAAASGPRGQRFFEKRTAALLEQ